MFQESSLLTFETFSRKLCSLLQIPSIPMSYRCEVFGAFSSLAFFSPLEVAKNPWAEVGDCGQCCIWSTTVLQLIPASHPFLPMPDSTAEQPLHIFLQRRACTPAFTLEAGKPISCSFSWSPNELNSIIPQRGYEGFSLQVSAAHYQIWKRQVMKEINPKSLIEEVLLHRFVAQWLFFGAECS